MGQHIDLFKVGEQNDGNQAQNNQANQINVINEIPKKFQIC